MKPLRQPHLGAGAARRAGRIAQTGLGLVELLVVILISTFMMAGLLTMVYGTRQNFTAQYQLAQLQDNERLAMTLITNVVQSGGYFYNPTAQSYLYAFANTSGTFYSLGQTASGQYLYGTGTGSGGADKIYVQFLTGPSDGVMDCSGATNSSGSGQMDVNYLYVDQTKNQLMCQNPMAAPVPLVSGVTGMNILYGVPAAGANSVSQYVPASGMGTSTTSWSSVVSVQVQLTFVPPATAAGAAVFSTTSAVNLTRTIDLYNRV